MPLNSRERGFSRAQPDKQPTFEAKGGTIIGAHKGLNPILIEEYSEDFELLVVEVKIRNKERRIISGYGPQETWPEAERMPFFVALEQEITKAEMDGNGY